MEEEGEKNADPALVATEFKTVTLAGEKLIKDPRVNWLTFFSQDLSGQGSTWRPEQAETEMFGEKVSFFNFF